MRASEGIPIPPLYIRGLSNEKSRDIGTTMNDVPLLCTPVGSNQALDWNGAPDFSSFGRNGDLMRAGYFLHRKNDALFEWLIRIWISQVLSDQPERPLLFPS